MPAKATIITIACCGPGDVMPEFQIVAKIVDEWTHTQGLDARIVARTAHWTTETAPDLSGPPQSIINEKMVDKSDVIVAIFWMRYGTPTALANSGTEEEIMRAIALKKRVLLYFSNLETSKSVDAAQYEKVQEFRRKMSSAGLYRTFKNRREFSEMFRLHFGQVMQERLPKPKVLQKRRLPAANLKGENNSIIAGDHNTVTQNVTNNNGPRKIKLVAPPPEGAVTSAEKSRLTELITALAALTMGKTVGKAKTEWWSRLHKHMRVSRYEDILSSQMSEAERWYLINKAGLSETQRSKAPQDWRAAKRQAIKAAMSKIKIAKTEYYISVSKRLKIAPAFESLKDLTDADLKRVYRMVLSDQHK